MLILLALPLISWWPVFASHMGGLHGQERAEVLAPLQVPILLLLLSHSVMSDSLWPHGLQHTRPSCPSPTPRACSNSCPLNQWCHPTMSSSVVPSSPAFNLSQHQDLFKWVSSSHEVAKVWEFQLQHQSFQWIFRTDFLYDGLVGFPCCPRDSQESSPTAQFKGINSINNYNIV